MASGVHSGGPDNQSGPPALGHPLSDGPLPHGKVMDVGLQHYGEFACSRSTLNWLRASGLPTVDGESVDLQVVEQCVGGHNVIVKVWTSQRTGGNDG